MLVPLWSLAHNIARSMPGTGFSTSSFRTQNDTGRPDTRTS